jgi:AcrR family transcriptional regulator
MAGRQRTRKAGPGRTAKPASAGRRLVRTQAARARAASAPADRNGPRERLLDTAYTLFSTHGINQVGIDMLLAESDCAKASLYKYFRSKNDLALAFLERREQLWTRRWLETEIKLRARDPRKRLLAIFDVFDTWFRSKDFEGCSFINVLLETTPDSPVRRAAAQHLAKIRAIVEELASEAGLKNAEQFAHIWHMLMKGSIIAAGEGNRNAAREAKAAAVLVIEGWAKR